MPFDPDKYLAEKRGSGSFDPDEYLRTKAEESQKLAAGAGEAQRQRLRSGEDVKVPRGEFEYAITDAAKEAPSSLDALREMGTGMGATMVGRAVGAPFGPLGVAAGGAIAGGGMNVVNQMVRMAQDPNQKFRWGELGAETMGGMIPGGSAVSGGVRGVAGEAVKQGFAGIAGDLMRKTVDQGRLPTGEETAYAFGVPAVAGGVAQKLFASAPETVSAIATAKANKPRKMQVAEQGAQDELKIVPSEAHGGIMPALVESVGGKQASERTVQLSNVKNINRMVNDDLGIPMGPDGILIQPGPEVLKRIREHEGKVYESMNGVAEQAGKQIDALDATRAQLSLIPDQHARAIALNAHDTSVASQLGLLKTVRDNNPQALRDIRGKMQQAWDNYYASDGRNVAAQTDAFALRDQAKKMEKDMEDGFVAIGRKDLADQLRPARERIAKTHNVEESLGSDYTVDPAKLKQLSDRGVPLGGKLKLIADFTGNFPRSVRAQNRVVDPNVSPFSMILSGLAGGSAAVSSGGHIPETLLAAAAIPAARMSAQKYLLSSGVQKRAVESMLPEIAAAPSAGQTALRIGGQEMGAHAAAPIMPTQTAIQYLRDHPETADQFEDKYGPSSHLKYLVRKSD
jgi:hypothetical protein